MKENRTNITLAALVLLLIGGLLLYFSYTAADRAVNAAYSPYQRGIRQYNATTRGEHLRALSVQDVFSPFHANGQMFPKQMRAGKPCGSDCIAQNAIKAAKVGPISVPWTGGLGAVLFGAGFLSALKARSQNPRRKLINLDVDRVRLKTTVDTLPIVQRGGARWGIMRRQDMKKAGRRQFGNGIFLGAPGKGKSSLLTYWLLMSDALNFVVIDLKGDLWAATAGHRATLGPVMRLDLSSLTGDALDPFDKDKKAAVEGILEILLPTDDTQGGNTGYFNKAAKSLALAYWDAARAVKRPTVSVLVQAATSSTADMLEQARELVDMAPEHRRADLLHNFQGAFSEVWDDPERMTNERGSMLNNFRTAFVGLNTPEIMATLIARSFDPAALVEGRGTLYITAPTTNAPYKAPLEMLLGTVIDEIFSYCDRKISEGEGPGEEIVILADEAGKLKVPRFNDVLATGRGRNVTLTAFLQDLGQLRQYHPQGWRGITDTIHHWTFWNTKNPDARDFLRDHCGEFDEPNPDFSTEQGKGNGPRYFTRNTFDEMSGSWNEDDVISLLDYDRVYIVHGRAVNPFKGPPKARAGQTPPQTPRQTLLPRVVAPVSRTATPQPASRSATATPPRQTTPSPSTRATSGHDQGDDLNSPPAATASTRPSAPMPTPARQPLPVFDDSDDSETF